DGDVLAEDIVVADLDGGRLIVVPEVLRTFAKDGAGVDDVISAERHGADEVGAGANDATFADRDRAFDDRQGTDVDVVAELGVWGNDSSGVDSATRRKGHLLPPFLGCVPRLPGEFPSIRERASQKPYQFRPVKVGRCPERRV